MVTGLTAVRSVRGIREPVMIIRDAASRSFEEGSEEAEPTAACKAARMAQSNARQ
jgi:hypothetical protein